ncbi:hypothetical protein P8452_65096 [Trifolium repens]|nr:hypothetical protein P8452_65096 [Trifolium repens]
MTFNAPLGNSNSFGNSVVGEKQQSSKKTSTPNLSESKTNVSMASSVHVARQSPIRRRRKHISPRNLPKITDQELQQLSGDLNSTIVPLFEKTLTASDVGRLGRMVLPKPCVETYFPPISQPGGIYLHIEDMKGKKLMFRFRFWPNNNSRIYVLEGVQPWIQSMQLQAGDFVTFSRMDPEKRLIIGFRKASISSTEVHDITISKSKKREEMHLPQELVPKKKRKCDIGSKSKQVLNNQDALMLKLTWQEAQHFLHPSPTVNSNIVVIENHVFEEYEEPPIIAKRGIFINGMNEQWIQCDKCSKWRKLGSMDNLWNQRMCSCSAPMN